MLYLHLHTSFSNKDQLWNALKFELQKGTFDWIWIVWYSGRKFLICFVSTGLSNPIFVIIHYSNLYQSKPFNRIFSNHILWTSILSHSIHSNPILSYLKVFIFLLFVFLSCNIFGTSVRRSSGRHLGVAVRAVDCWH